MLDKQQLCFKLIDEYLLLYLNPINTAPHEIDKLIMQNEKPWKQLLQLIFRVISIYFLSAGRQSPRVSKPQLDTVYQ